jgi:hypothetical protein
MVPCQDHREFDFTEYSTKIKLNFDSFVLKTLKSQINKEIVEKGIYSDENIYLKDKLAYDYRRSNYMFKDELYSELNELSKL